MAIQDLDQRFPIVDKDGKPTEYLLRVLRDRGEEVTNKVDKVTSTDNAVVRFDGTTGDVQNSSVIVTDDGQLQVGSAASGYSFAVGDTDVARLFGITGTVELTNAINFSPSVDWSSGGTMAAFRQVSTLNLTANGSRYIGTNNNILIAGDGTAKTLSRLEGLYFRLSFSGNYNGTITEAASIRLDGPFNQGGTGTPSITSYYGLYINGSATYAVNNWGIFIAGSPNNDLGGGITYAGTVEVDDEAYGVSWNGSLEVPTKNAVYDKIESLPSGGGGTAWWFDPPLAASFTLASSDATNLTLADDADVGMQIYSGASSAAGRFAYVTLTDKTLAWDYVVRLDIMQTTTNFSRAGVAVRDSISGRMIFLGATNNIGLAVIKDSALGTFSATALSTSLTVGLSLNWMRVQHTGGNIVFSVSPDGKQWVQLFSETATTFLTNRANQVGFLMHANTQTGRMTCGHYALTGPGV